MIDRKEVSVYTIWVLQPAPSNNWVLLDKSLHLSCNFPFYKMKIKYVQTSQPGCLSG